MIATRNYEGDSIGSWTEDKLDILRKYAAAYSVILNKYKFHYVYIDAFSGKGEHVSKKTGEPVKGSPVNAINVTPPFKEYFFIDSDIQKAEALERSIGVREDVHIIVGNANKLLIQRVFPKVKYCEYRRGLCFLDPYGIHLNWDVIEAAASARSIELFINFSIMDINRNIKRRSLDDIRPTDIERMNAFWGDDSWIGLFFDTSLSLFDDTPEKKRNDDIAEAYQQRLISKAGFEYVPKPLPMLSESRSVIYYLFFASHNEKGGKIARDIFRKYAKE